MLAQGRLGRTFKMGHLHNFVAIVLKILWRKFEHPKLPGTLPCWRAALYGGDISLSFPWEVRRSCKSGLCLRTGRSLLCSAQILLGVGPSAAYTVLAAALARMQILDLKDQCLCHSSLSCEVFSDLPLKKIHTVTSSLPFCPCPVFFFSIFFHLI